MMMMMVVDWATCGTVLGCSKYFSPHCQSFYSPVFVSVFIFLSYDSNMDDSRDNKKNRFSNTMVFMEEYLNNVLNDELPFHNEEKNKLTYEV